MYAELGIYVAARRRRSGIDIAPERAMTKIYLIMRSNLSIHTNELLLPIDNNYISRSEARYLITTLELWLRFAKAE